MGDCYCLAILFPCLSTHQALAHLLVSWVLQLSVELVVKPG